ncbi:MAG: hypothetical protein ACLSGW_06110 [Clostridium sp.]
MGTLSYIVITVSIYTKQYTIVTEGWKTGIRRFFKHAEEYQLPTPEFMEIKDTFRVNLYRPDIVKPIKADKKPINDIRRQLRLDLKNLS